MKAIISNIKAREVLDSRGNPTIEVEVYSGDVFARSIVPSGASTGESEAYELRDNDKSRYLGKGVLKAIYNVENIIKPTLIGKDIFDIEKIDELMIKLDNSSNKKNLGANAILGVSMACVVLASKLKNKPLYEHLSNEKTPSVARMMLNVINGGSHAGFSFDIQEFMIVPIKKESFLDSLRKSVEVYQNLKLILKEENLLTLVGDEGGFAPKLSSNKVAIEYILRAIKRANYNEEDFKIALDVAANEFYDKEKKLYFFEKKYITSEELLNYYNYLVKKYPIISIEDPFYEKDFSAWEKITSILGNKIQIVGDDLFTTNIKLLKYGIEKKLANAILIKPNQIGSISETLKTIKYAKDSNFNIVISHRSGESEDVFISHLASSFKNSQIKTGAPSRGERTAKYNEMLRIHE